MRTICAKNDRRQVQLSGDAPAVAEYLPAGHGAHVEAAIAPTTAEYVRAGHVWHAEAPASAEYWPVEQSVHVEDPAAQARAHTRV
jgi:hypothetical protein